MLARNLISHFFPWRRALWHGSLIAVLGLTSLMFPPVAHLEPDVGLKWLFNLRGPRPAPEQVAVITIDRDSSRQMGLPNVPRKWPRELHAELVRNLHNAGATVISFDMIFTEAREPKQDANFAEAMREAGNVVLFEYMQSENIDYNTDLETLGVHLEQRSPPIPLFADAAVAVAPFHLPKIPERVNQAWLFKAGAGDLPTLPVVALHHYFGDRYRELQQLIAQRLKTDTAVLHLLRESNPNPATVATQLHQLFRQHPELLQQLRETVAEDDPLQSLFYAHAQNDRQGIYLDFYGPSRAVNTLAYHEILANQYPEFLKDKAIFVGFSERLQPEQKDGFYTAFTNQEGLDVSGVEIMATTFANLLEQRHIQPLKPPLNLLLILFFGMIAGALLYRLPGILAVTSAVLIAGSYLVTSYALFSQQAFWLPLVIPLLIQLPIALLSALLAHYLITHKKRMQIHHTLRQYLPEHVANAAAENGFAGLPQAQLRFGVCLMTDAADYTSLSESLSADALHGHINPYFEQLFEPVRQHGGHVMDVKGDAIMALWLDGEPQTMQRQACEAAAEIQQRLSKTPNALPTRIGIHCGEISVGNVGAGDHYEYRAVGDVVNTASRIEGLNKLFGTKILVSGEVAAGLNPAQLRCLGDFLLKGKQKPIQIYEYAPSIPAEQREKFSAALTNFQQGHWQQAIQLFSQLQHLFPDDVASHYFYQLAEQHLGSTPPDWNGIVKISLK